MRPGSLAALALIVGWLALAALAAERSSPSPAQPGRSMQAREQAAAPSAVALRALREGELLDLNRATLADLELLPGVGPRLAERIADARRERGGRFGSLADLQAVSGIGPAKLERIGRVACAGEGCKPAQRSSVSTSDSVLTK
jgi:competence ComEA-like helix-hairpin-helix protein